MHLCNRADVAALIDSGGLVISPEGDFLDEHRVALHIEELYELVGEVDLRVPADATAEPLDLEGALLRPGSFYLGVTRERLSLGPDLAASLHTRSRYARLGLEALQSSNFVVPGFGTTGPAPIVFEITVRRPTSGLSRDEVYCFLNLYRIALPRTAPNSKDYNGRFPMQQWQRADGRR